MTKQEIVLLLAHLKTIYPSYNTSDETVISWSDYLKDYTIPEAKQAIKMMVDNGIKYPLLTDIIENIKSIKKSAYYFRKNQANADYSQAKVLPKSRQSGMQSYYRECDDLKRIYKMKAKFYEGSRVPVVHEKHGLLHYIIVLDEPIKY